MNSTYNFKNQLFSFESLEGLPNLTHLCLAFNYSSLVDNYFYLNENGMKGIDINLPKLAIVKNYEFD